MMHFAFVALATLFTAVSASPQGVTAQKSPPGTPICSSSFNGPFQISVVNASTITKRSSSSKDGGALVLNLNNGVLTDQDGRTGYIASNQQFQFDSPPQHGALWTAGFSICPNMTLALKSTSFYECFSGKFYNLYDTPAESNCTRINFMVLPALPNGSIAPITVTSTAAPSATVTGPARSTITPASQISDGQPQVPTSSTIAPITQISDGQPQAPTLTSIMPVTQISDGQVQAPTNATVPPPFSGAQSQGFNSGSFFALVAASFIMGAALI